MSSIQVPLTGRVDRLNPVLSPQVVVETVPNYGTILFLALAGVAVYYLFFNKDDDSSDSVAGMGVSDFAEMIEEA